MKKKETETTAPAEIKKATPAAVKKAAGRADHKERDPRLNLALTPDNHEFIKLLAGASGQTMTSLINSIITAYRTEHPELSEKAKGYIDFIKGFKW